MDDLVDLRPQLSWINLRKVHSLANEFDNPNRRTSVLTPKFVIYLVWRSWVQ